MINVNPLRGHRAGGSIITVTTSGTFRLQFTDKLNCIFDDIPVAATYENETTATCVMPLINNTGIVPFVFEVETRVLVPVSKDFESRECTTLYTY